MLLPLPYGVEGGPRRPPRATIALIAACSLVFAFTLGSDTRRLASEDASLERLAAWELTKLADRVPELARQVERYPGALAFLAAERGVWEGAADAPTREKLAGYLAEHRELTERHPYYRYGLVPARITFAGLIGHLFLHGDLLHLFFNMLFLWVVGAVLEDDWGTPVFLAFYVAGGLAAGFAHAASDPRSIEPAIGASGAVAALMGAFAVQRGTSRMRILLIYGLGLAPRFRTVAVPAWLFLGMWFLEQVFWVLVAAGTRLGIAFWAHIGGFVFGSAASFVVAAVLSPPAGGAGAQAPSS